MHTHHNLPMKNNTLLACTLVSLASVTSLSSWATTPEVTPDASATAIAPTPTGLPLWEAGLAAGAGYVPDYPGADRYSTRAAVLPVFTYRGPVLRIDGGSVSGRLARSSEWELDLSANGAFNANNNALRKGMPDLDYLFGVGPQAIYKGLNSWPGKPTLHLKLRAILSTDFSRVASRGVSFDPQLRWRLPQVAGTPATLSLSLQPSWASKSLQAYFYQVNPAEATATRSAYDARAGYMGTEAGITLSHRPQRNVSWFVTARLLSLHGAANTASPLLRDKSNVSVGAGLVWTPWRSAGNAAE